MKLLNLLIALFSSISVTLALQMPAFASWKLLGVDDQGEYYSYFNTTLKQVNSHTYIIMVMNSIGKDSRRIIKKVRNDLYEKFSNDIGKKNIPVGCFDDFMYYISTVKINTNNNTYKILNISYYNGNESRLPLGNISSRAWQPIVPGTTYDYIGKILTRYSH